MIITGKVYAKHISDRCCVFHS